MQNQSTSGTAFAGREVSWVRSTPCGGEDQGGASRTLSPMSAMCNRLRWSRLLALAALCGMGKASAQTGPPLPLRPSGLAFDSVGNLYFSDANRHQVYEISLAGTLSLLAGTGAQGYGGEDGPATAALLNEPHGLAVAPDGAVYVADTGNHRVRVVRAGVISTVAGTGVPGFGGDGGPASAALLNRPLGLALAADGRLFIADSVNQRVRAVRSGTLSTVAGSGVQGWSGDGAAALAAALNQPEGVGVAADGRLFIADTGNARVRVVSSTGTISTLAGAARQGFGGDGGPAAQALLNRPKGVALSAAGEVFVTDSGNARVRRIGADGVISTLAGTGTQGRPGEGAAVTEASLDGPEGVALSSYGRVWFADGRNATVRATADGRIFQPAGIVVRSTSIRPQSTILASAQAALPVDVIGQAGRAEGAIRLLEGGTQLAAALLADGAASLHSSSLTPGTHALTLLYDGDVLNPAASVDFKALVLQQGVLVATAAAATMHFGEDVPPLSGTLEGVPTPDAGRVQATFSTPATSMTAAGFYPITATLSGPAAGSYTVLLSATSGQLTIAPQGSTTAMLTPLPVGYDGLPLSLTALVSSGVKAKPTGSVMFVENGTVLAAANLVNGSATATFAPPPVGQHAITAKYLGDGNFLPSETTAQAIGVSLLPDFALQQVSTDVPTMDAGSSATFKLQVSSAPAPFTGAVALSASGLPVGWTAHFAPPSIIPGVTGATVTLTLTASTAEWQRQPLAGWVTALLFAPFAAASRRRWRGKSFAFLGLLIAAVFLSGCGDRVASTADLVPPHPASFTVTGTAANLAGRVVTHSVAISYLQP